MLALITAILVASLIGSPHCAGMCGPFVLFCVGTEKQSVKRHFAVQAAYHGGRLICYSFLGLVAGSLGAATNWGGDVLGYQRIAMMIAGILMLTFGILALLRILGVRIRKLSIPRPMADLFMRGQAFAQSRHPVTRALLIGLLAMLLPCGWLYLFVIWAAGTGSPLAGMLVMMAFWAGTVPILTTVGIGAQTLLGPLRKHLPAAMAIVLIIVGGMVIQRGLSVDARADLPSVSGDDLSVEAALQRVKQAEEEEEPYIPPCCREDAPE